MMEISCDSCGKKYKIDESKMKGARAKVKCRVCANVMVINRLMPETDPALESPTEFLDPGHTGPSAEPDPASSSKGPQVRIERPYAAGEQQATDSDRDLTPFVSGLLPPTDNRSQLDTI